MPSIIEIVMMIAIVTAAVFSYLNWSMMSKVMATPVATATTATTATS